MDFDTWVDTNAAALDAEAGPAMHATAEGSLGSRFSDAMRQIRDQFGAIPWFKLFAIANVVVQGLMSGKSIGVIVAEVLALLASGQI